MHHTEQKKFNALYKKQTNALKRQGMSDSTIDVYSRALRRISEYLDCCPDKLSVDQLKDYFDKLLETHSWSTVKSDRCGLQFFYAHVLERQWDWVKIVKPPVEKKLPDILSYDEISSMINAAKEARFQCYILTVYSMGLRLSEALNLTIADIDADHMQLHVRLGKGNKDRMVIMPHAALDALRWYWSTHRNPKWIFPSGTNHVLRHRAKEKMGGQSIQRAIKAIAVDCNIHKNITTHSLRHCYATHLLSEGLNLHAIQRLLGHESPLTTAMYTQLTESAQQNTADIIDEMLNKLSFTLDGER